MLASSSLGCLSPLRSIHPATITAAFHRAVVDPCVNGSQDAYEQSTPTASRALRLPQSGSHVLREDIPPQARADRAVTLQASLCAADPSCGLLTRQPPPAARRAHSDAALAVPGARSVLVVAVVGAADKYLEQAKALIAFMAEAVAAANSAAAAGPPAGRTLASLLLLATEPAHVPALARWADAAARTAGARPGSTRVGLAAMARVVRPLASDSARATAHSNKIRALEQPEAAMHDWVLYTDTDTVPTRALFPLLSAALRGLAALPAPAAPACVAFARGGLVSWGAYLLRSPEWRAAWAAVRDRHPEWACPAEPPRASRWINTGVLLVRGSCAATAAASWRAATAATVDALDAGAQDKYFADTLGLIVGDACPGLRLRVLPLLPVQLNAQLSLAHADVIANGFDSALASVPPAILHYALGTLIVQCRDATLSCHVRLPAMTPEQAGVDMLNYHPWLARALAPGSQPESVTVLPFSTGPTAA